jgi:hypothetical protein
MVVISFYVTIEDQFKDASGNWLTGRIFIYFSLAWCYFMYHIGIPEAYSYPSLSNFSCFENCFGFGIDKTVGDIASIQGGFPPYILIYHSIWKP